VIVLETLLRRWYVVAFIVGYFGASVPERGWKASIRFELLAYGVAFVAEFSSTRNGFPFSHYAYTQATRGDELFL
jgi:putative membrane protein